MEEVKGTGKYMLKYSLVKEDDGELIYEYFPEGGAESGMVSFQKETGECIISVLAAGDRHQRYALKLCKALREMAENQEFKSVGMIAWY